MVSVVEVVLFTLLRPKAVMVQCGSEGARTITEPSSFRGNCSIGVEGAPARRFTGEFVITRANDSLRVVWKGEIEELTAAIVSAESPPNATAAMLEAQAVVARSWLVASKRRHGDIAFCDTTHCQHFKEASERGIKAARATKGLVLSWQGRPFAPAYSASCGGRTKTASEIGWRDDNRYPYFAVDCPVCQREEPRWKRTFSGELAVLLQRAPNKESTRLAIGREDGWDALPSNNYRRFGDGVEGRGRGHGLGLCQRGSAGFSTAAAILAHYFPGASVMAAR